MHIMGDQKMSFEEIIDKCTTIPRRKDVIKNDVALNHIWRPRPIAQRVETAATALERHGFRIIDSAFALNKTGHKYVGAFKLEGPMLDNLPGVVDGSWEYLMRGSNDTSTAEGRLSAQEVAACTNGLSNGELIAKHKNTKGLDYMGWEDMCVSSFIEACIRLNEFTNTLMNIGVGDDLASKIILEATRERPGIGRILPKAQGADVWEEWTNPIFSAEDFPPGTAYKLYSDFTHVSQKCSPHRQMQINTGVGDLILEMAG